MKKSYLFPIFFLPVFFQNAGCVCPAHKELCAKNEEMKTLQLDLQGKDTTIAGLLDRLSLKDQEIGKLTDELHTARMTIEDLRSDIEKLREIDVQVEEKKKEVDDSIEETISAGAPGATPETEPPGEEELKIP